MRIDGYGVGNAYGGLVRSSRGATGVGVGVRASLYRPNGGGTGIPFRLYFMTPFAYLTFRGVPHDATFENFMFHLQVEQLVHRRMG